MVIWSPLGTSLCCSRSSAVLIPPRKLSPHRSSPGWVREDEGNDWAKESRNKSDLLTQAGTHVQSCRSQCHTQKKPLSKTAGQSGIAQCQLLNARAWRLGTTMALCEPVLQSQAGAAIPLPGSHSPTASHLDKFRGMRQAVPARDGNILITWRVQLPQLSLHACSIWNKGFEAYKTCTVSHSWLSSAPSQNQIQAQSKIIQREGGVAVCAESLQRDFSMVESSFASWSARLGLDRQQNTAPKRTLILPIKSN